MIPLLILGLVWMTNLYNFMDGSDGLAGGMTTFGFGAYAIAAGLQGHAPLMMLALCTAAAAAGFLLFNFPPARIFIGDVGSVPLGLLAGAVGLMGWRAGIWPLIFPLVVFAPFVVDATVTLLKRVFRRERIWKAHREHYYQRLILSGWTHRRLAIAEYAVMLICAISGLAIVFVSHAGQVFAVAALGLVFLCLMLLVDRRWQSYTRTDHA
jgi:UDP-N-acetylmuramyl pentapeptide phosphotransferase/UDP-N-acetylglucosamine-1-phosphate transferase